MSLFTLVIMATTYISETVQIVDRNHVEAVVWGNGALDMHDADDQRAHQSVVEPARAYMVNAVANLTGCWRKVKNYVTVPNGAQTDGRRRVPCIKKKGNTLEPATHSKIRFYITCNKPGKTTVKVQIKAPNTASDSFYIQVGKSRYTWHTVWARHGFGRAPGSTSSGAGSSYQVLPQLPGSSYQVSPQLPGSTGLTLFFVRTA